MTQIKSNDNTVNYNIIFVLTLIHFAGDFYSSFFAPLLPAFVDKLDLTLAQVGLITGMIRLLSFIVQPVTGYLADRYETRSFVLAGLFLAFFFIPFSGIAPNFWVLMTVLCIGSIGSSIFHPATTGMVPLYAGNRTGFCLSIYNTGGILAFALGPVFITWYVGRFGLEQMPYTLVLGAFALLFCIKYLPVPVSENLSHLGFFGSIKDTLGKVYKSIFLIWLVMVLRAVTGQTFMTFMPIYLTDKGHNLVSVGLIFSLFILAGTFSGLLAGWMADRTDFKKIFFVSHAFMTPALLLYLYLPGQFVYLGSFLAGFAVLASLPLGVVMAQKLAPKSRSMVSSLMMGFAYGLGGALSPIVGKLADIYGLENVLFYSAFIPVVTLIFILKFPKVK
ncbi:MFS transporter [Desulfobacula toluolica]|uniref:Predicted permease, major facilitator superfamiy, related to fosmidomycin resistance protein Fsr n=1 Tax=Desulfobacula toluolica (strain DSM 7467 / Tol2) TaxID=651182 RepID=K0N6P2_DESTT|nr:MFS transporter [Desulfobacula toluolica]CCK79649.1 predicted permease, major facilitator superfamiy, related to fosmidomycin resistance protein Fsr [Desulfobacula toluolica Tol2]